VAFPAKESTVFRRVSLVTALLSFSVVARPCAVGGEPAARPAVPSSELVKAGAVWDAPPDPLSISLAADGTISLLGHEVGLEELRADLREKARDPRLRNEDGTSKIDVVLRVESAFDRLFGAAQAFGGPPLLPQHRPQVSPAINQVCIHLQGLAIQVLRLGEVSLLVGLAGPLEQGLA
jgi:biopolymer transport protein ExbD